MSLVCLFSRLSLGLVQQASRAQRISTSSSVLINPTSCLYAEPLKKKRRIDPSVIRAREERKKRKLEKMIKKLVKYEQPLKPLEENMLPLSIMDQKEKRMRAQPILSSTEEQQRVMLLKNWSRYRLKERYNDVQLLDRIAFSQQRALDALRQESEELYQAAIQLDNDLVPFKLKGPCLTAPIQDHESPDGDYHNVSFKWD